MKKSILFKLFRVGAIPRKQRPVLELEEIIVADEGMGGWLITKNVKGPGKRFINRAEGFSGWLAITKKRIVCYTYWKRQINISLEDPKIYQISVNVPREKLLSLSCESSVFRDGWSGSIEFRFKTEKAQQFYNVLKSIGMHTFSHERGDPAELIELAPI